MQQQCSAVSCNITDKTKTLEAESELPEIYCVYFFRIVCLTTKMLSCETFILHFFFPSLFTKRIIIKIFVRNIEQTNVKKPIFI